jgi:hypothetical protein
VTANLFKAKNNFSVINATNSKTMGFIFPYSQGGAIQLNDSNEVGRANLFATDNGGYLYLYDSSGNNKINLNGTNGNATFGGAINSSGGIVCGGLTARTQILAQSNAGVTKVFFAATDTYGYGAFRNANGDNNIYLRGDSGNIECVSVTQTSSRKVKENIKPIEDAEKILQLQAVPFDFKDKAKGTDRRGFIAEDVAEVLPNLVSPETEDRHASLDYIGMIPYLQDMLKKQQAEIDILKAEIEKLKGDK